MSMVMRSQASPAEPPLVLRWGSSGEPLPMRVVRAPGRRLALPRDGTVTPAEATGTEAAPFDFCGRVRRLCADIVSRCEAFWHIDISRVLFGVTQARNGRKHGLQARLTPLRFRDGCLIRRPRGVPYQVQRYFVDGREMLYLLTVCLPRFLDQTFEDKFVTLFHELYHIGPGFDGDLRRHAGRCAIHSRSKQQYDLRMAGMADAYLKSGAPEALHQFLRLSFAQLNQRHGAIVGVVVPRPRVVPVRL